MIGPEREFAISKTPSPSPSAITDGFGTHSWLARNTAVPLSPGAKWKPALSFPDAVSYGVTCTSAASTRLPSDCSSSTPRAIVSAPCITTVARFFPRNAMPSLAANTNVPRMRSSAQSVNTCASRRRRMFQLCTGMLTPPAGHSAGRFPLTYGRLNASRWE